MKTRGFVLVTVLIFLFIFTLFALSAVESNQIDIKLVANEKTHQQLSENAEAGLKLAESSLDDNCKACLAKTLTRNALLNMSDPWWQLNGQQLVDNTRIIIENLGLDPCARINKKTASNYYRITAKASDNEQYQTVLLQSTIALPHKTTQVCDGTIRKIQAGRQSWRWLS